MTIPTRIKRWLQTDDGKKYILVRRATWRAVLWLLDGLRPPASEVEPEPERIARDAARASLQSELPQDDKELE